MSVQYIPDLEPYIKRLNSYITKHYPAGKKITSDEWNALLLALVHQGNTQEETLAKLFNSVLPQYSLHINQLVDHIKTIDSYADTKLDKLSSGSDEIEAVYSYRGDLQLSRLIARTVKQVKLGAIAAYKSPDTVSETIPQGTLFVADPIDPYQAANKNYVDERFNGASKGVAFGSYSDMVAVLNSNATAPRYTIGQNIYIGTLKVPDLWIAGIPEGQFVEYNYTTEEAFADDLRTNGKVSVGRYILMSLETQKVDLTEYAKSKDVNALLANKLNINVSNDSGIEAVYSYRGSDQTTRMIARTLAQTISGALATYKDKTSTTPSEPKGVLVTANPLEPYHAANKAFVEEKLAGKIDATLSADANPRAYVCYKDRQSTIAIASDPSTAGNGKIAQFYNNERTANVPNDVVLMTGTPTQNKHCANKKYVDDSLVNKLDLQVDKGRKSVYVCDDTNSANPARQGLTGIAGHPIYASNGQIAQYLNPNTNYGSTMPTGILVSAMPNRDYHTTNKKYVDERTQWMMMSFISDDAEATHEIPFPNLLSNTEECKLSMTVCNALLDNGELVRIDLTDAFGEVLIENFIGLINTGYTIDGSLTLPYPNLIGVENETVVYMFADNDGEVKIGTCEQLFSDYIFDDEGTAIDCRFKLVAKKQDGTPLDENEWVYCNVIYKLEGVKW